MPLCSFADGNVIFDVTPVENMFIMEYMPAAPGDYVRVYLYGLMMCYHPRLNESVEDMSRALRIDMDTITNAFRYWEREGLVERMTDKPPTYQYIGKRGNAALREPLDAVYKNHSFNQELQKRLGAMALESHELRIANEWIDDLKLPQDVVLKMVDAEIRRRNGKLPAPKTLFKYLNATALIWAEANVKTDQDADDMIWRDSVAAKCASSVLKNFGLFRKPTSEEILLAEKWVKHWNYTEAQVLNACKETSKSANPSFAYLDKILESRQNANNTPDHEAVKSLLKQLGVNAVPTQMQKDAYRRFLSDGFPFEVIEQAAIWCGENNRRTFEDIGHRLSIWKDLKLFTAEAVDAYRQRQKELTDVVYAVFSHCGMDKRVTKSDIDYAGKWQEIADTALIMQAAEFARGMALPMKYVNKLLLSWNERGIKTVEAAKRDYELSKPANPAQATASNLGGETIDQINKSVNMDIMKRRNGGAPE